MRIVIAATILALSCLAAAAFEWGHYTNPRFGYSIDVPPEFSAVVEPDNGDGGVSTSQDKLSQLAVWGSNLVTGGLAEDFASRVAEAQSDGWEIGYRRETPEWAVWSGSQQGRLFYAKAIKLCGEQAAYFLLEYPRARKESFDPIVERLSNSLKNLRSC